VSTTEKVGREVVELAMNKASNYLLGAAVWSIGLGILNTVFLLALLIVVIVK
jgi:hypothetical protein